MNKWNLVIDVALCENCNNCALATKDELVDNEFPGYSATHARQGRGVLWLERQTRGRGHMVDASYRPSMCNHCDDGPCLKAGSDGSVRKREDGIVLIDPIKAKGRRDLVEACPYGAIVWNEEQQLPQNWFFDAHLLDQKWTAPRCVGVCPTQAIEAIKVSDDEMNVRAQQQKLSTWRPELRTRSRVYYKNLDRFEMLFVGASLEVASAQTRDCVERACIDLLKEGRAVGTVKSDAFGDFKFDGFPPHSGNYQFRIHCDGYAERTVDLELKGESLYLGALALQPS